METQEKILKVGKTDTYSLTISSEWLNGETIDSAIITVDAAKVTYNSQAIVDNVIYVSLTGVESGSTTIHIDYTTATRTDCDGFRIKLGDC